MTSAFDFEDLATAEETILSKKEQYRRMAVEMHRQNHRPKGRARDVAVGHSAGDTGAEAQEKNVPIPLLGPADQMSMVMAAVYAARGGEFSTRSSTRTGIELDTALFLQPGVVHPFYPGHPDLPKIQKALDKR